MKRTLATLTILLTLLGCNDVSQDYGIVQNFKSTLKDNICTYTICFESTNPTLPNEILKCNWKCGEYAVGDTIKLQ